MDYRCPSCGKNLGTRKRVQAVIARIEIDCTHCYSRIRLNLHPLELKIVYLSCGLFVVLAALAYWYRSDTLILLALGAGMTGPAVLPVLERTFLRTWARYVPAGAEPGRNPT